MWLTQGALDVSLAGSALFRALPDDIDKDARRNGQQGVVKVISRVVAHGTILAKEQIGAGRSLQKIGKVIGKWKRACGTRDLVRRSEERRVGKEARSRGRGC